MVLKSSTTLIVVSLLLAFLFVVSFQPVIVGNAVYTSDKADLSSYPYPFIKNNLYNDVYIVIGAGHDSNELFAAEDVAYSLKGARVALPPVILENEIPENAHNLILVGTPCTNTLVAEYLGTADCNALEEKGVVSIYASDRKAVMVVSGRTGLDVRKAALFLQYIDMYLPSGSTAFVDGQLNANSLKVIYTE